MEIRPRPWYLCVATSNLQCEVMRLPVLISKGMQASSEASPSWHSSLAAITLPFSATQDLLLASLMLCYQSIYLSKGWSKSSRVMSIDIQQHLLIYTSFPWEKKSATWQIRDFDSDMCVAIAYFVHSKTEHITNTWQKKTELTKPAPTKDQAKSKGEDSMSHFRIFSASLRCNEKKRFLSCAQSRYTDTMRCLS